MDVCVTLSAFEARLICEGAKLYHIINKTDDGSSATFRTGEKYFKLMDGPISVGALSSSLIALTGERPLTRSKGASDGGLGRIRERFGAHADKYLEYASAIHKAAAGAVIEADSMMVEFLGLKAFEPDKAKSAVLSFYAAERTNGKAFVDAVRDLYPEASTFDRVFDSLVKDLKERDPTGRVAGLRNAEKEERQRVEATGARFEAWGIPGQETSSPPLPRDFCRLRLGGRRFYVQPTTKPALALTWSGRIHVPMPEDFADRFVRDVKQGPGYATILDGGLLQLAAGMRAGDLPHWTSSKKGLRPVDHAKLESTSTVKPVKKSNVKESEET